MEVAVVGDGGGALGGKRAVCREVGRDTPSGSWLQKRVQYLPVLFDVRITWLWMRIDTATTYNSSQVIEKEKARRSHAAS